MSSAQARRLLLDLFSVGVEAVHPEHVVHDALAGRPGPFTAIVATGKAAPGMTRAATAMLPGVPALVVSDHPEPVPAAARLLLAAHPVPDARSLAAGAAILELCTGLGEDDRLLYLLSGGSSALVEALLEGITLEDLAATTDALLRAGATIHEINSIRTAISAVKGGGVARAAHPAEVVTLAISDVVDDDPTVIGSGPTTRPVDIDPRDVVTRYGLTEALPDAVLEALDPRRRAPAPAARDYEIVASGPLAAAAVVAEANKRGLSAEAVPVPLTGDAAIRAREVVETFRVSPGLDVMVLSGETTVVVTGAGAGGRNQEAALAAAIELEEDEEIVFLAGGTDGIDGPTDAAGGLVDGSTVGRGRALGLSAEAALAANDSSPWLDAVGARLVTGPTGTNVGDLWILARISAVDGGIA